MSKRIIVTVARVDARFAVRVLSEEASNDAMLQCAGALDAALVIQRRLDLLFAAGDEIVLAHVQVAFTCVADAMRAVEVALDFV